MIRKRRKMIEANFISISVGFYVIAKCSGWKIIKGLPIWARDILARFYYKTAVTPLPLTITK